MYRAVVRHGPRGGRRGLPPRLVGGTASGNAAGSRTAPALGRVDGAGRPEEGRQAVGRGVLRAAPVGVHGFTRREETLMGYWKGTSPSGLPAGVSSRECRRSGLRGDVLLPLLPLQPLSAEQVALESDGTLLLPLALVFRNSSGEVCDGKSITRFGRSSDMIRRCVRPGLCSIRFVRRPRIG